MPVPLDYTPQQVPIAEDKTRLVTRPWLMFFQKLTTLIQTILGWGLWTDYAITVGAVTTAPTDVVTLRSRYTTVNKLVVWEASFLCGAGFAAGVGTYLFTPPLPVVVQATGLVTAVKGVGQLFDTSASNLHALTARIDNAGVIRLFPDTAAAVGFSGVNPVALAAGDEFSLSVTYETP